MKKSQDLTEGKAQNGTEPDEQNQLCIDLQPHLGQDNVCSAGHQVHREVQQEWPIEEVLSSGNDNEKAGCEDAPSKYHGFREHGHAGDAQG